MKKAITLLFVASMVFCQAQTIERYVISSGGGTYFDGSNFEMDFTLGELAVTTVSNAGNVLTQGFQQPFFLITSGITENPEDAAQIALYPNPVDDNLNIFVDNATGDRYGIELYDMLGQLLIAKTSIPSIAGSVEISLDVSELASGNYFLRIVSDSKIIETSKIIKINQ